MSINYSSIDLIYAVFKSTFQDVNKARQHPYNTCIRIHITIYIEETILISKMRVRPRKQLFPTLQDSNGVFMM